MALKELVAVSPDAVLGICIFHNGRVSAASILLRPALQSHDSTAYWVSDMGIQHGGLLQLMGFCATYLVFQTSWAAFTFCRAVSAVNGGTGGLIGALDIAF